MKLKNTPLYISIILFISIVVWFFPMTGNDDTFITYWSAKNLAEGKGFINQNYEPMEVSSSFLFTIFLAFLYKLNIVNIAIISRITSLMSGALILIVSWKYCSRFIKNYWVKIFIVLFTSLSINLLYWSGSGMETTLVALVYFLMMYYSEKGMLDNKQLYFSSVLCGLMILLRSEGFITIVPLSLILLFKLLNKEIKIKQILKVLTTPLITLILITYWRLINFGIPVPNPAIAKATNLTTNRINQGISYFLNYIKSLDMLFLFVFLLFFIIFLFKRKQIRHISVGFIFSIIYILFVIIVGGDWMPSFRFLVIVTPLISIIFGRSLDKIELKPYLITTIIITLITLKTNTLINYLDNHTNQNTYYGLNKISLSKPINIENIYKLNFAHRRDLTNLIPTLKQVLPKIKEQKGDKPLILTGQMGFIPYIINNEITPSYFIDRYGLTNYKIASNKDILHNEFGVVISYYETLKIVKQFNVHPDIIYDLELNLYKLEDILKYSPEYKLISVNTFHGVKNYILVHKKYQI